MSRCTSRRCRDDRRRADARTDAAAAALADFQSKVLARLDRIAVAVERLSSSPAQFDASGHAAPHDRILPADCSAGDPRPADPHSL